MSFRQYGKHATWHAFAKIIKIYCNHSAYFNVLNHGLLVIHSTQIPGNTSHVGIECPLGDLAVRFHLDVLSQTANGLSSWMVPNSRITTEPFKGRMTSTCIRFEVLGGVTPVQASSKCFLASYFLRFPAPFSQLSTRFLHRSEVHTQRHDRLYTGFK